METAAISHGIQLAVAPVLSSVHLFDAETGARLA